MKTMKNKLNCLELNPLIKIKLAVKCKTRAQQVYVTELVKSAIVKSLVHSFFTSWCNFSDWWDFVPLISRRFFSYFYAVNTQRTIKNRTYVRSERE